MEGLCTIYRTHHIKGMMSPSYYIYTCVYIYHTAKLYIRGTDRLYMYIDLTVGDLNYRCDIRSITRKC